MEILNITYREYFDLEDKSEYDFAIRYSEAKDYYNIGDFTELPFGLVKDLQFYLQQGFTFDQFIEHFEKITKLKVGEAKVIELFGYHKYLQAEIQRIVDIENKLLSSDPTNEELRAGSENFEKFGSYPQFRSIMVELHLTEQQVYDMTYNKALTELLYQKETNDYQKKLNNILMDKK